MRNVLYAGDHRHPPPTRISLQRARGACCDDSARSPFLFPRSNGGCDRAATASTLLYPPQRRFARGTRRLGAGFIALVGLGDLGRRRRIRRGDLERQALACLLYTSDAAAE